MAANEGGFYGYPSIVVNYYDRRYEVCGLPAVINVGDDEMEEWLCQKHYAVWIEHENSEPDEVE
jgi:hypothetical protein